MHISSGLQAAWLLSLALAYSDPQVLAAPKVGASLPLVTLSGEAGGRVDGQSWSSQMLKDKVWVVFYVAPSHRDDNQDLKDALNAEGFPGEKYGSVAVINMASSWLPNSIIASALKSNQEKYPKVIYVKDLDRLLVKEWHLADDAFVMLVIDQKGQVISAKEGDLSKDDIAGTIALIKKTMATP